jgi:PAS domain S-box-containing protein
MYRKDGSTMWVLMNVRRVQTTDGTVYFEGLIQDITERRRAEAEQRKQEALRQAHDELERRVRERTAALAKANADLRAEVAERQRAEVALRENLNLVQAIIDGTTDAIFVKDLQGRYVMINAAGARFLGKPVEEILGKDDTALFSPDTAEAIIAGDHRVLCSGTTQTYEDVGTSIGITRTYLATKGVYRDPQGTVIGLFGISRDITEHKQMDEHLKASLYEKELLLKEIHHRVKNNLQIISSLLSLQARYLKVPQAQHALEDSKNRIKSIALLHELLYQSKDIAKINFAQYIRSIVLQLFHAYNVDADTVTFEINADDRVLEIDAAIPFGLIINELVSNALKHAFPEGRRGKISVELSSDEVGVSKMIVGDDGIGFPKGIDWRMANSLGLKLVVTLAHQLSGTIELDQTAGARFTFTFGHPHITKG